MNQESFQQPKRTKEFNGKNFEVDEVDSLSPSDINRGDQVIVITASGNRYMIRRSESRGGALMISNEKTSNFQTFYPIYMPKSTLAVVGTVMEFTAVTDEEKNLGTKMSTTEVISIEIRRGLDKAINSAPQTIDGSGLAAMLTGQFGAKKRTDTR